MDLGLPAQQSGATLEGVEWQLEESIGLDGELVEVPWDVLATANFADARVSGSTGCNRYSGSYTITDDGALSISEVVSTMMACLPEADAVERAMLTALDRTVRAKLGVDRLSLIDADGRRAAALPAGCRAAARRDGVGRDRHQQRSRRSRERPGGRPGHGELRR